MKKYNSIVISDVHLFANNSNFSDCFEFLKNNPCNHLYLNGDIMDFFAWWKNKSNFWKQKYIINDFLKFIKENNTELIYLIGNHDYHFYLLKIIQPILGFKIQKFHNIYKNNKKIHITHGDWIPPILKIKKFFNKKINIANSDDINYINYGKLKNCDLLFCGHTHNPKYINLGEIIYINSGDWVKNNTAIVEDFNDNWNLINTK